MKKYWQYIIIMLVIVIASISVSIKNAKIAKLEAQNNISLTLLDSVRYYKNKLGEVTAQHQAFNVKFSLLKGEYDRLDVNSKLLVKKIQLLEKEKLLISATNIHQTATIDSLVNNKPIVNNTLKTLQFRDSTKNLRYDILVELLIPRLTIKHLFIPNELYLSYKYSPDRDKILIDVSNGNELFKTNDVVGYIIPLEPKRSYLSNYLTIGGIGIGVGIIMSVLLLK